MSLLAEAAVGELLGTLSVAVSAMYTLDSGMPRSAAATCNVHSQVRQHERERQVCME